MFKLDKKKVGSFLVTCISCMAVMAVACFAEDTASVDVTQIMASAMTDVANTILKVIAAVVAAGITLMATKMGITYGISILKKLTGKFAS